MLPAQLAKSGSEHGHQRAFFQWTNFVRTNGFRRAKQMSLGQHLTYDHDPFEAIALMHAIPNGGGRTKIEGAKLKAEGVKAGVPDTFLPLVAHPHSISCGHHGLYIEFKVGDNTLTTAQKDFMELIEDHTLYRVQVAWSWWQAANFVTEWCMGDFDSLPHIFKADEARLA